MTTDKKALEIIKKTAAEGKFEFAPDTICASLDAEIQQIYSAIRIAEKGKPPKRPIWISDGNRVSICMEGEVVEGRFHVYEHGLKAIATASQQLGIALSADDIWEEAAMRLRDKQKPNEIKS